jgi:hypothetical protein
MTADIVTFPPRIKRDALVGRCRRASRKDLDRDLVYVILRGLGFTVANGTGDPGGR